MIEVLLLSSIFLDFSNFHNSIDFGKKYFSLLIKIEILKKKKDYSRNIFYKKD